MAGTTTLYLRSIPVDVVRAVKSAAAMKGSTLGAFVTDALVSSLSQTSNGPDELAESMEWYEKNRAGLRRRYPDEYVAIVDCAVVDHDEDFQALARRVFAEHGVKSIFMPRVTREERPLRFRSPRRARL